MVGARKIVGIVQPSYLPWLAFFERMLVCDVFVLLDDVEYSKNSFFNRNAIKTHKGKLMLTIPVMCNGQSRAKINEIEIDNRGNWARKHLRSIEQAYAQAPFMDMYREKLADLLARTSRNLLDATLPQIEFLRQEFQLTQPIHLASQLDIKGCGDEKLTSICQVLGGTHIILKPGTEHYHDPNVFKKAGLGIAYLTYSQGTYDQLHGPFEKGLSALDYLLNTGPGELPFKPEVNLQVEMRP